MSAPATSNNYQYQYQQTLAFAQSSLEEGKQAEGEEKDKKDREEREEIAKKTAAVGEELLPGEIPDPEGPPEMAVQDEFDRKIARDIDYAVMNRQFQQLQAPATIVTIAPPSHPRTRISREARARAEREDRADTRRLYAILCCAAVVFSGLVAATVALPK